jgi:hypothetical protein
MVLKSDAREVDIPGNTAIDLAVQPATRPRWPVSLGDPQGRTIRISKCLPCQAITGRGAGGLRDNAALKFVDSGEPDPSPRFASFPLWT